MGRARALLEQARLKNPKAEEAWLAGIRTEQRAGNTKAAEAVMAKALQVGRRREAGLPCAKLRQHDGCTRQRSGKAAATIMARSLQVHVS